MIRLLAEMDRKLDTSLGEIDRKLDGVRKQYSDLEFLLTVAPTQATALLGPIASRGHSFDRTFRAG